MEKFDSFFESLNILESSLQNIKKENNFIQTPVYTFVKPYGIPVLYIHLYYYAFLACIENTQISGKSRAKIVNISCKKVVLRNVGNV
jgi:hypothetical protein